MRAFWSSLVVLCLLAAPVRPSEPEVREQGQSSTIGVANRHGVVAPIVRRTATGPIHTQSPFIAPDIAFSASPTRTAALVSLQSPSLPPDASLVLTRSARGPPCS